MLTLCKLTGRVGSPALISTVLTPSGSVVMTLTGMTMECVNVGFAAVVICHVVSFTVTELITTVPDITVRIVSVIVFKLPTLMFTFGSGG